MREFDKVLQRMENEGVLVNFQQKWRQEGWRECKSQILKFLKTGHSLEEAEAKFAYAR